MDLGLTDKVAIVTGSSRGLGLGCAAALVAEGCRVTVCARGEARLTEAAAALRTTAGADWHEAFDHTLFPAIRASRLAVPEMRRRGGGVIIIIASIYGRESGGRMTYNAVKAAEISLAKSMAQQLARDNIRVNSVAPGSISFPGGTWHRRQQEEPEKMAAFVRQELPFGRFG